MHARPAKLLAEAAQAADCPILIGRPGGDPVDARSILMVMSLGLAGGEAVELNGPDGIVGALAELIASDLDSE
jgi:phosphocarrier protein